MRRGLLAWDRDEVPAAVLDARVDKCRTAMLDAGLDALLLYNNFPRPAAVSWLTHFVPYWSQGVLLIPRSGPPEYFVSLSKRVAGWVEETSHMGQVVSTPRLGQDLARRLDGDSAIGVLELSRLPGGIARPLLENLEAARLMDATDLFRAVRHPADEAEIALSRRAAAMAQEALDAGMGESETRRSGSLTAAIEGPARLAGAEEVIVELAPDLEKSPTLLRLDGDVPLGERYAVRLSLAYKGYWVRVGRTPDGQTGRVTAWLRDNLPAACDGTGSDGIRIGEFVMEACIGSFPLTAVSQLPAGAVGTANFAATLDGIPYPVSLPVLHDGDRLSPLL